MGRVFRRLRIGSECRVGALSVIMADLVDQVTVAAGTVVARDVESGQQSLGIVGESSVRPSFSKSRRNYVYDERS